MTVENLPTYSNMARPAVNYQQISSASRQPAKKQDSSAKKFYDENKEFVWAGAMALGVATWAILSKKNKLSTQNTDLLNKLIYKTENFDSVHLKAKMIEYRISGKIPANRHLLIFDAKNAEQMTAANLPKNIDADLVLGYTKQQDIGSSGKVNLGDFEVIEFVKAEKLSDNLSADVKKGVRSVEPIDEQYNQYKKGLDDLMKKNAPTKDIEGYKLNFWAGGANVAKKTIVYGEGAFPLSKIGGKIPIYSAPVDKTYTLKDLAGELLSNLHLDVPKGHDLVLIRTGHLKDTFPNLKKNKASFLIGHYPKNNPKGLEIIKGVETYHPDKKIVKLTDNDNHAWVISNDKESSELLNKLSDGVE